MDTEHRYILKPTYGAPLQRVQPKQAAPHYNSYNKIMNQLNLVAKYPMPPQNSSDKSEIRNDEYLIMNTKRNKDFLLSKFDSHRQVRHSTSVLDSLKSTRRDSILTDRLKKEQSKIMGQTTKSYGGLSNSMTLVNKKQEYNPYFSSTSMA